MFTEEVSDTAVEQLPRAQRAATADSSLNMFSWIEFGLWQENRHKQLHCKKTLLNNSSKKNSTLLLLDHCYA